MDDCEIITATDASRGFSDLLHRVCYGGESFVIKKGNRLMARIVPVNIDQEMAVTAVEEVPEPIIQAPVVTESVASEEDEFYHAWMEQVRKVPLLCE